MAKILIVDDHAVVREGFRRLFEANGLHEIVGEAGTSEECVTAFKLLSPSLVVLDVMVPGADVATTIQRINNYSPTANILIVTLYDYPSLVERCFKAGARGYVTKTSSSQVLLQATKKVARGQQFISPDLSEKIALKQLSSSKSNSLTDLSPRALDVFMRIARGQSIKEISAEMHISKKTVSNHSSKIKKQLGLVSITEFVSLAIQEGILIIPHP